MTPFVTPVHPDPLTITLLAAQYKIALTKTVHGEALKAFQIYQLIHRVLVQKVLDCIEDKYLMTLCNRITRQAPAEIYALILHLFIIYGKISPQKLRAKYGTVEDMTYLIEVAIDIIFSAIEDLVKIGELAGHPFSPVQIIDLGFIVIMKHQIFRIDIKKWIRRPIVEQTWVNFKNNFTAPHQELRDMDTTVNELGFHITNAIVSQIIEKLRAEAPEETKYILSELPAQPALLPQQTEIHPKVVPVTNAVHVDASVNPAMVTITSTIAAMVDDIRVKMKGLEHSCGYG